MTVERHDAGAVWDSVGVSENMVEARIEQAAGIDQA